MGRTANNSRMEVWVDEAEDFIPNKSNRQIRRSNRHKTKEKFRVLQKMYDYDELKNLEFDDFFDQN